jgi:uncharacterized protein (DUF433 family)/DNA-binding transcriptional MerR regulator
MVSTTTPIGSYSAAEVARLAGVSPRRIGRWAREGIILPSVSKQPNHYSYADAGEAILAHYLMEQGKPPRDIKAIVHSLRAEHGDWPLATAPLAHDGQLLLVKDAKTGRYISVDRPGHEVIGATLLNLKIIRDALGRGGWVAIKRPRKHIEVDPDRHSGSPVVRGRRLPTALVAGIAADKGGRAILRNDYELSDDEIDDAVGYETEIAELAA